MLTKIIPLVLGLAGAGAGAGVGLFVLPAPDPVEESDHAEAEDDKKSEKAHAEKKDDHDSHGDDGHGATAEYVKLTNQFVVPIVERERVASMVVLSLSIEVQPGTQEKVYSLEPKLRDGFLRVLFDHANMGGFSGTFTDADMLGVLRGALKDVARRDAGDMVRNVLIVHIARQDV